MVHSLNPFCWRVYFRSAEATCYADCDGGMREKDWHCRKREMQATWARRAILPE